MEQLIRAEKLLKQLKEMEAACKRIDKQVYATALRGGPSGYVGQSQECRGQGLRRRSGSAFAMAQYLLELMEQKKRLLHILSLAQTVFMQLRGTKEGRLIYLRFGQRLSTQACADRMGISRRQYHRRYVRALQVFTDKVTETEAGTALLNGDLTRLVKNIWRG